MNFWTSCINCGKKISYTFKDGFATSPDFCGDVCMDEWDTKPDFDAIADLDRYVFIGDSAFNKEEFVQILRSKLKIKKPVR